MVSQLVAKDEECIDFVTNLSNLVPIVLNSINDEKNNLRLNFSADSISEKQDFTIELVNFSRLSINFENSKIELAVEKLITSKDKLHEIFCTSPLADPYRFYLETYLFLKENNIGDKITSFLNTNCSYQEWMRRVSERAYKLIVAPEYIINKAIELLEDQAIEFQVLPTNYDVISNNFYILKLNSESYIIAESIQISVFSNN